MKSRVRLLIHKDATARLPRIRLIRLFESVVKEEAEPDAAADVNLIFTDDRRLHELNRDFRRKDRPTDVLSFNVDPMGERGGTFGEIYISVETADRQAEQYRAPRSEEYLRLTCHGLLHLFGYDHVEPEQERQMKAREEHFLSRLRGQ
ncbi:rRNA maturation RNase YbeY [candidate division GN15 bacterium]|nr:rRNA maturation RNase YbeY [candidate division GN15 bacterium]